MGVITLWFSKPQTEVLQELLPLESVIEVNEGMNSTMLNEPGYIGPFNNVPGWDDFCRLARVGGIVQNGEHHASGLYALLKPNLQSGGVALLSEEAKHKFPHIPSKAVAGEYFSLEEFVSACNDACSCITRIPVLFYATEKDFDLVEKSMPYIFPPQ